MMFSMENNAKSITPKLLKKASDLNRTNDFHQNNDNRAYNGGKTIIRLSASFGSSVFSINLCNFYLQGKKKL